MNKQIPLKSPPKRSQNVNHSQNCLSTLTHKNSKDLSQGLAEQITNLSSASTGTFKRIVEQIDLLVNKIGDAESRGESLEQVSKELIQYLKVTKPLGHIKSQFKSLYKKISALGKKIHNLKPPRSEDPGLTKFPEKSISLLNELLGEHFMRMGKWECSKLFIDQEGNPKYQIFRECYQLRQKILQGSLEDAITWTRNQRLFESKEDILEYDLRKMQILELVRTDQHSKAFTIFVENMAKFHSKKAEELELLLGYILMTGKEYWRDGSEMMVEEKNSEDTYIAFKEMINNRYQSFSKVDYQLDCIADSFVTKYLAHYELSRFDSIWICYQVGLLSQAEFIRLMGMMEEEVDNSKSLPFSLNIPMKYKYHSLLLCPVSKEVLSSGATLLDCGHIISQSVSSKLMENRNRRRLKCPVCQKDQRSQLLTPVVF